MKRRLFTAMLMLCALLAILLTSVCAQSLTGEGTAQSPYLITSTEDLLDFASSVNSGENYAEQFIRLEADLDLQGISWRPIGTIDNPFCGTFDGAGHSITNLSVMPIDYSGLFGCIGTRNCRAAVQNLILQQVSVQADTSAAVGTLAGNAYAKISGIQVITAAVYGYTEVGGLVGNANNSIITDCAVQGRVTGLRDNAGGIAGTGQCSITDCYADVSITCPQAAGGILGQSCGSTVQGNYVTGTVACCGQTHSTAIHGGSCGTGGIIGTLTQTQNQVITGNYCNALVRSEPATTTADFPLLGSCLVSSVGTTAELSGNSWNRAYLDTDTVAVEGLPDYLLRRDNNLVATAQDLAYLDAAAPEDVTILQYPVPGFTPVTQDAVQAAWERINCVAFVDANLNGVQEQTEQVLTDLCREISDVPTGCTLVLTRDHALTGHTLRIAAGQKVILDLAGHTLSGSGQGPAIEISGNLTLKDSGGKGALRHDTGNAIVLQSSGSLQLLSGKISAAGTAITHEATGCLSITGGEVRATDTALQVRAGSTTVSGDAVINGKTALSVVRPSASVGITLAITGGKLLGDVTSTAPNGSKAVTGFVTGGQFSTDVIFFCADGYATIPGEDGLYAIKNYGCSNGSACTGFLFRDAPPLDNWAHAGIDYVYYTQPQLMNGTSANTFSPDGKMTRAQLVTVLYRAAGSPKVAGSNPFRDCEKGSYYYNAVTWASAQGITTGTSAATFTPNGNITREQTATFLYRYAKATGSEVAATGNLSAFPDAAQVSGYARTPMSWAVGCGLINGVQSSTTGKTTLQPSGTASRAQMATIMMRFMTGR